MENQKEIKLKVNESIQDDVNKGITRIDSAAMRQIGVRPGDIIEIIGGRAGLGIVDRAYPGDIGLNIIRMDGLIRRNAKTGIGETVTVRKADVKEAKSIVIAPAKKSIVIRASADIFKQGLLGRPVLKGDIVSLGGARRRRNTMVGSPFFEDIFRIMESAEELTPGFSFGELKFIVLETNPKGAVVITDQTEITINPEAVEEVEQEAPAPDVTYEDIGGLSSEVKKIREMVELPLKYPQVFERLGIEPPKGVLLYGPPGTGKTLLAKAVANETNSHFLLINGPEIMSKFYGQSEENLRNKFEDAEKNAPAIIFIDEIDAIAPKREEVKGEVEKRVVAQLLTLMDGLKSRGKVVVIAATNVPNSIDPALRRPGRFDRELEIGVPSKKGRYRILKIHTRNMPIRGAFYDKLAENVIIGMIDEKISKNKIEETQKEEKPEPRLSKQDIKRLEELKKELDSKDKLEKIIAELKALENSTEIWNDKDPKSKLIELTKGKNVSEALRYIEELMDLGVIKSDFYNQVRNKGVSKELKSLASITYGFVGADLSALAKEAAMEVLRKILPEMKLNDEQKDIPKELLERLWITKDDFLKALKTVRPSALREISVEIPNVKWENIGGLEKVKQELKEAVEWPLKNPKVFRNMGIKPPKGVLLYGAPGTGKTMLAKAVAHETKANFISIKGPELLSKWVGESEKAVREIFKKARQTSPTIIFFDEIDSLAPRRGVSSDSHVIESVVNQLLTEMDGLEELQDVIIIGATNRPDIVDPGLLRPGRFDRIVLIPIPDKKERKHIFQIHTKNMHLKNVNMEKLAEKTEGYVGADIEAVCREAAIHALREDITARSVSMKHFEKALEDVRPSVTKDIEKDYDVLKDQFKAATAKQMREDSPSYFG